MGRRSVSRSPSVGIWKLLSLFLLVDRITRVACWSWSFSGVSGDQEEEKDESLVVSPIVNRQLETSVKAHHWPTTPQNVFCEAFAYHGSDFVYLDRLIDLLSQLYDRTNDKVTNELFPFSWESARDVALRASTGTSPTELGLLQVSLDLRSASPLCETHRSMARQALIRAGKLEQALETDVFAVVYPEGHVLMPDDMRKFDWTSVSGSSSFATESSITDLLLPGEQIRSYGETVSKLDGFVVLYGNFGTGDFVISYERLVTLEVPLVVRHMGVVRFEEDPSLASPTTLQGYGVRVDIRNVEYKVFDDRRDRKTEGDGALNLTAHPESQPGDLLAGIDLELLGLQDDTELKLALWKKHEEQQVQKQKVPPVWQRRQLPLQASTVISQAEDPLSVLAEVSQNLPSLASLLVNVKIPEEISKVAELMESNQAINPGRLYVNGRKMFLDSASFNIFEILNVIREEEASLRKLEKSLSPYFEMKALRVIQDAWIQGESFEGKADEGTQESVLGSGDKAIRIDVGRGWKNAVIYLNDVEKDAQYARWPRSVRAMLQSIQFGMPPAVRRNMFTVLSVSDPIKDPSGHAFQLAMQLIQSSYPARLGVLWVSQDDVDECRAWLRSQENLEEDTPCPVKKIFSSSPSNEELTRTKATAQAAHRLLVHVVEEYDFEPQIPLAFTEYMLSMIEEHLQAADDMTMKELIDVYTGMVQAMGLGDAASADEAAREVLMEPTTKYGHALRFAVDKNLSPGMGFVNGRPLVGSDPSAISKAFGEEQQHILGLIVNEKITDTAPKSVYAMLLSGNKVYKKVHPLLFAQDDTSSYIDLEHDFGPDSLLFPHGIEGNPEAFFVAEILVSFSSMEGLAKLKSFLGELKHFPNTVDDSGREAEISTGYRILPASRDDGESPICPLLARANQIGLEVLSEVLEKFEESSMSLSFDQLIEILPDDKKISVRAQDCASLGYLTHDWAPREGVILNGRSYQPENGLVSTDDLDLLISMEFRRALAVLQGLREFVPSEYAMAVDSCGKAAAFLGLEKAKPRTRSSIIHILSKMESKNGIFSNPLRFRIPGPVTSGDSLQSEVTVVLDPVSDAAQRISSFLVLIRESLNLPIDVILSPATLIDGDSKVPITSYYRFVASKTVDSFDPLARFSNLPTDHILTIRMDVPEPWDVQQTRAVQDTDNLRCDSVAGCSDFSLESEDHSAVHGLQLTYVEYGLSSLLIFGQCYETSGTPPNGLQLVLTPNDPVTVQAVPEEAVEIEADGSVKVATSPSPASPERYSDTLVMKNKGYWQLRANAGVWDIMIADDSKGSMMFDFVEASVEGSRIKVKEGGVPWGKKVVIKDFVNRGEMLFVRRKPGMEQESLFYDVDQKGANSSSDDTIHVFSLATGHLYERFLKIMMLSVTKRTSTKVKFWLFENFLSPTFKATAKAMADRIGCEVDFVTYKWPEWLRGQSEKQRIIWGYKILFLDVLFPLDVKKIIYVDADQVVRGDLKELWDMDLKGAPYGYTPFCTSRESTLGYQFWRDGFWKSHLQGKPYHISALYVVDLETFRRTLVGDVLRATYQQLSADPNSLANLDQDLPNYAQHQVPIFSLPQEWLWCESWCSDETKATAKTIDLCNNPMHKEPKVSMAKRVISGPLFNESWVELDAEVESYEKEYFQSIRT